jgi:predicted NACHT family NTPase
VSGIGAGQRCPGKPRFGLRPFPGVLGSHPYPNLRACGAGAAQNLADRGGLLPVLDSLDEIPTERRRAVIEALNASLHRDTGLILISRSNEYTEILHTRDILTEAAVIQLA